MSENYLKDELYALNRAGDTIFDFLQAGALDGIWYWDMENPDEEWMSPRFWETLGYDPEEKEHKAWEWQSLIHPEDLEIVSNNLENHKKDPTLPYDQIIRYRHKNGHWVFIRCRGLIIRDEDGVPVRMLGTHTDITEVVRLEQARDQIVAISERLEAAYA